MGLERQPLALSACFLADPSRNDVAAHARQVLGVVVVELVLRNDFECWQRLRPLVAENPDRHLGARDEALD